jgi:hypothetical protein
MTTQDVATKVAPEEHAARVRLAKALFDVEERGNSKLLGEAAQVAFDANKKVWIGKAIKIKKSLARQGYEFVRSS